MTAAEIHATSDDLQLNREAMELLFGPTVKVTDSTTSWDGRTGRRRWAEYMAATGDGDPGIADVIAHYARQEGVEFVGIASDGRRTVLVPGPRS